MIVPYEHQAEAADLLGEGDFIYFMEKGCNVGNSGTVGYVDDTNVDINNVNGDGDSITRKLEDIILCYDTEWDDDDFGLFTSRLQEAPRMPTFVEQKKPKKSRAKYEQGEQITSYDELMKQDLIYCHQKIQPRGWFLSWQLRLAELYIRGGALFKVVKKEG